MVSIKAKKKNNRNSSSDRSSASMTRIAGIRSKPKRDGSLGKPLQTQQIFESMIALGTSYAVR